MMARSFHLVPPTDWRRKEVPKKPKALVVEADYSWLTSRIDPNVVFWKVGFADAHTIIPNDITVIWISPSVSGSVRHNLMYQALKRDLKVWKCSLLQLRERLLPIWGDPRNRSLILPATPESDLEEEADRVAELLTFERESRGKRLPLLRAAAERVSSQNGFALRKLRVALEGLPILQRKVFETRYGLWKTRQPRSTAEVADQFLLEKQEAAAMIRDAWRKLAERGFAEKERWLVRELARNPKD